MGSIGMEETLEGLNLSPVLAPCREYCSLPGFDVQEMTVRVPSSYREGTNTTFDLAFTRLTRRGASRPIEFHLLLLNGGPGTKGRGYRDLIMILDGVYEGRGAFYEVQHRGVDGSAEFKDITGMTRAQIEQTLKQAPFPYKHLNLDNSAIDLGAVAMCIKKTGLWRPEAKIGLYGFSYGAKWGHTAVTLLPNTFNFALLGGLQPVANMTEPSARGLYEHCERSQFCHMRFGGPGRVASTAKRMLKNLFDPTLNECTAALHRALDGTIEIQTSDWSKAAVLMLTLGNLFAWGGNLGVTWPGSHTFHPAQVAFAFLKATHDCRAPAEYISKVLPAIERHFDKSLLKSSSSSRQGGKMPPLALSPSLPGEGSQQATLNQTVYALLQLHTIHGKRPASDTIDVCPTRYSDEIMMSDRVFFPDDLDEAWGFRERPAVTLTTNIGIFGSALDLNTPPETGYWLFHEIQATWKGWLHCKHVGHDTILGAAGVTFFDATMRGDRMWPAGMRKMVKKLNQDTKLDWSFAQSPLFQAIWEQVEVTPPESAEKSEKMPFTLPACERASGGGVRSLRVVVAALSSLILIVALVFLAAFIWLRRRMRRREGSAGEVVLEAGMGTSRG